MEIRKERAEVGVGVAVDGGGHVVAHDVNRPGICLLSRFLFLFNITPRYVIYFIMCFFSVACYFFLFLFLFFFVLVLAN